MQGFLFYSDVFKEKGIIFLLIVFTAIVTCNCKKQNQLNNDLLFTKYIAFKPANNDSANFYFKQLENNYESFTLENQSYYWSLKGFMNNRLSNYYLSNNNFDNALKIATKLNNDTLKAFAYKGKAEMYTQTSELEKAIECYLNALKIYEKNNDIKWTTAIYAGLAGLYQENSNFEKAFYYVDKALSLLKMSSNNSTYLSILHTKANLFGMNNKMDSALAIDNYALRIIDSLNLKKYKSKFLNNKALCYLFGGEPHRSEPYFLESIAIDSANGDKRLIADSYIFLTKLYIDLNNETKANYYHDKALLLSKQIHNNSFIAKCFSNKTEAYIKKGDYKNALLYKDSVIAFNKKTNNEAKTKTQLELTELYESEKKDNLLKEKNNELFRLKLMSGFVISIITLALVFVFVFFKNYKKINNLQTEKKIEDTNQNERIRISRDLHDNMGAFTTSLLGQIESLNVFKDTIGEQKVNDLRVDAENIMSTLRETIWILKTKTISVNQFFELIKTYINKNLAANLAIKIIYSEDVTTIKYLSPTLSLNLYRIIQEIVQNIIKHSEANQVNVNLTCNQSIKIEISDNGKGFNYKALKRKSGLENMEFRANEIKFHIDINSEVCKGAVFKIFEL